MRRLVAYCRRSVAIIWRNRHRIIIRYARVRYDGALNQGAARRIIAINAAGQLADLLFVKGGKVFP